MPPSGRGPAESSASTAFVSNVDRQRSLCRSDRDCPLDQSCCAAGLIGMCSRLGPAGECPAPDLVVSLPPATPRIINRFFAADDCLLDKCVGGRGARRLLTFPVDVANAGNGDIILALPEAPGVRRVSCDDTWFVDDFLRYELIDMAGAQRASGAGDISRTCGADVQAQATTPFDCVTQGLEARSYRTIGDFDDCQWVDITTLPAGDYTLRVSVNAGVQLSEASVRNNTAEVPVTIPPSDPLAPCEPGVVEETGGGTFVETLECGWELMPGQTGLPCVPGEPVLLQCSYCDGGYIPRVCPGVAPCSDAASLLAGSVLSADGPCSPEQACDAANVCTEFSFTCPASGLYTLLGFPEYVFYDPGRVPRSPSSLSCLQVDAFGDPASEDGAPPLPGFMGPVPAP
jgi:lysyl oxidase